jgi:peptidoglycan/LPS O-acetylase OafA/YrhL
MEQLMGTTDPPPVRNFGYRPLGAFRLFLALLVVFQHYALWVYGFAPPIETGNIAVLVFFFLSGFVITEAADLIYAGRPAAFLVNRFLRIVPLFVIAILMSCAVLYSANRFINLTDEAGRSAIDPFAIKNLIANLWSIIPVPGRLSLQPSFPMLRIAWALRVELAFYVCVALLLFIGVIIRELSFRLMFSTVASVLLALSVWYQIAKPEWNPLIRFVPFFSAGAALYFLASGSKAKTVCLFASSLGLTVAVVWTEMPIGGVAVFVALITGCALLAVNIRKNPSLDRLLGDLSYPVYVGHWLPLLVFANVFGLISPQLYLHARTLATVVALALPIAYFVLIDRAVRRLRAFIRGVSIR